MYKHLHQYHSIYYRFLFEHPQRVNGHSENLRSIAANVILNNPNYYNEALLGRPTFEYVQWICKSNTWGGAIELSIFSEYYQTQIVSIDIQTLRQDIFGEDHQNYLYRVFLLYSGIHYDAIAHSSGSANQEIVTKFLISDDMATALAIDLADQLRALHHYTDLSNFTITCDICHVNFIGEKQAQEHAIETKHTRFSEYNS